MNNWSREFFKKNRILKAKLTYPVRPSEEEMQQMEKMLKESYEATEVFFEEEEDKELISGYILQVGDQVFDNSVKRSFEQLQEHWKKEKVDGDIISILKSGVQNFDRELTIEECGTITRIGDGIVAVEGMTHAVYGEIVIFENGAKGLVQNIDKEILCILLGDAGELEEGSRVIRTGKRAGVPVGDGLLGRVVDPLGAPIDGKEPIEAQAYNLLEREAPGVIERQSVNQPLQTGVLAIDSMFPIGRGQRELIIGDRQTGKTSIAVDTILNQKDKDVICVYVAIAQKASTVAQVVANLTKHDAMRYSVVVVATASDSASLQYIAPYAGTAMAEYFMDQGKDVLIVYDDLSKHAVAYRALSLLLERSPGREAYPGDVFYLHSRLLERSCRLDEAHGSGSITALPIIETQASDVSAYIPTNVISITDGQIFLESELFFAGNRPAVNVGLSVSRVGGAAQTKAMKKATGSLRIDLAQYKEMESFSQFSSDLDEETRQQLKYGESLMELLKQPLYQPKSLPEQVITLYLANHKKLIDVELTRLRDFVKAFYQWMSEKYYDVIDEITTEGTLSDENGTRILEAIDEYKRVNGNGKSERDSKEN